MDENKEKEPGSGPFLKTPLCVQLSRFTSADFFQTCSKSGSGNSPTSSTSSSSSRLTSPSPESKNRWCSENIWKVSLVDFFLVFLFVLASCTQWCQMRCVKIQSLLLISLNKIVLLDLSSGLQDFFVPHLFPVTSLGTSGWWRPIVSGSSETLTRHGIAFAKTMKLCQSWSKRRPNCFFLASADVGLSPICCNSLPSL